MNDVLLNDVAQVPADLYLQTHSTNPLLRTRDVTRAIDAYFVEAATATTRCSRSPPLQTRLYTADGRGDQPRSRVLLRTQDLPPVMEENSCLYVFTARRCERHGNRIGERPAAVRDRPRGGMGHRRGDRLEDRRGAVRARERA